jgi:hypothetical protein
MSILSYLDTILCYIRWILYVRRKMFYFWNQIKIYYVINGILIFVSLVFMLKLAFGE